MLSASLNKTFLSLILRYREKDLCIHGKKINQISEVLTGFVFHLPNLQHPYISINVLMIKFNITDIRKSKRLKKILGKSLPN